MKRTELIVATLVVALVYSSLALAQGNGGVLHLSAVCDGSDNVVTINVQDQGGLPELVGFDIFRQKLGDCDNQEFIRITDQPLSRTYNESFTVAVIDDAIEPETMYCYRVKGVDGNREEIASLWPAYFEPDGIFTACASCGLAPIAQGTLLDGGWTYFVTPCGGACYGGWASWIEAWASNPEIDFAALAVAGDTHIFYGTIGCGTVEGCLIT